MLSRALYLYGLFAAVLGQDPPADFDLGAAVQSISAELSSPSFVAYAKPSQKVEEFIAAGDSYTAGPGCNGNQQIFAGDAVRGQKSYPMQMASDGGHWKDINGDETLPRFSFSAFTGDKAADLIREQLIQGDFKENNKEFDRGQPFGKPQLAVVSIGGNDAMLSDILNNCIYHAWLPKDCSETLKTLQNIIDDGTFRNTVYNALYQVAKTGRESGGADPRENFQVYVPSYMSFYNEVETACDQFSWNYWGWSTPKLDTNLRKQLNSMTKQVNEQMKLAIGDLSSMGVIFVEGLEEAYEGHRFCESRHTTYDMIDYDTWFWSLYAHFNTPSEGPGDPQNPYSVETENFQQLLLNFVFPDQDHSAVTVSEDSPPWEWEGAQEKYPTFESLMVGIQQAADVNATGVPINLLRSFHPKGTAFGEHKTHIFGAIVNNRDEAGTSSKEGKYTERCKDWEIKDIQLLIGTCTDKDGKEVRSEQALELCLSYDNGALTATNNGMYKDTCSQCFFNPPDWPDHQNTLWCVCRNDADPFAKSASVKLDDLLSVQEDGYVKCFDHISAPTSS